MNKIIKTKKGISLIVLIVTIAVIIVLATAVILSVANDKPIDSAKEAVDLHNSSVLVENATVLSSQWTLEKRLGKTTISRSDYVKQGLSNQGFTSEEIEDLVINEWNGKIGEKGGAIDVASNPEKYYGKEVDYKENSGSGVSWKIFYSDESNIYLIASDYILYANIPNSTQNGVATTRKPNEYSSGSRSGPSVAYFPNILQDYIGSDSITDSKIQDLNSSYFAYLKSNGSTSTNNNMKAVAYMLDKDAWKVFAGEDAEYAIGGPTSEIFIKSYKQKYSESQLEYQALDVNGYKYRNGSSDSWSYYENSAFNTTDPLYVITGTGKAYGMWLASPSYNSADCLVYVGYDGNLSYHLYFFNKGIGLGFRPLVCLKSSIKLEESGSGYIIK